MLFLLRQHFWWPPMVRDARAFVATCPVCASGKYVIRTIVGRFSKAAHLVPVPKRPSAAETGDLLVSHMFRLNSIPRDDVSDREPQFTSPVWLSLCGSQRHGQALIRLPPSFQRSDCSH